jgi:hypothetical protein
MYPPHVADEEIKHLIRELSKGDRLPSGAKLRTVLQERFGSRGGVSRVYRLLSAARAAPPTTHSRSTASPVGKVEHEIRSLQEALSLADHREQAHQSRWAMEVDRLRQQVAALEPLALKGKVALDAADLLRHQLHAAHVRITELEGQLLDALEREGAPPSNQGLS